MNSLNVFTENLFSFARMLGSKFGGGKLSGPSGSVAAASGLPYAGENYLLLSPMASPFETERLIAFFRARDLTFVVPILPGTPQKPLAALETSKILPVHTYTAMSLDLAAAGGGGDFGAAEPVVSAEGADEWGRTVWEGFDDGEEAPDEYLSLARHLANRPENALFLLREGGAPVSCALLHRTERSCGVYYFATPPVFRRRGYARRLMGALAAEAARDYKELVLLATPEGLPFYEAFGFKTLAKIPLRSNSSEI